MNPRIMAATFAAILVGAFAGPSVASAFAATTTDPPPSGPGLAVTDLLQNVEFDVSSQGIQALLGDFPLVGDYG